MCSSLICWEKIDHSRIKEMRLRVRNGTQEMDSSLGYSDLEWNQSLPLIHSEEPSHNARLAVMRPSLHPGVVIILMVFCKQPREQGFRVSRGVIMSLWEAFSDWDGPPSRQDASELDDGTLLLEHCFRFLSSSPERVLRGLLWFWHWRCFCCTCFFFALWVLVVEV